MCLVSCLTVGFEFLRADYYILPPVSLSLPAPTLPGGISHCLFPGMEPPQLAGALQVSHPLPVHSWERETGLER